MVKITGLRTVKSFKNFCERQKLKPQNACVDDGECMYKIVGYKVHNYFIKIHKFSLDIYMYDEGESDFWVVR